MPKWTIASDSADFESELGVVRLQSVAVSCLLTGCLQIISKDCKDVKESEALDYVLGYTSTNDVSSRVSPDWCTVIRVIK